MSFEVSGVVKFPLSAQKTVVAKESMAVVIDNGNMLTDCGTAGQPENISFLKQRFSAGQYRWWNEGNAWPIFDAIRSFLHSPKLAYQLSSGVVAVSSVKLVVAGAHWSVPVAQRTTYPYGA
jgi:hypothetical protein